MASCIGTSSRKTWCLIRGGTWGWLTWELPAFGSPRTPAILPALRATCPLKSCAGVIMEWRLITTQLEWLCLSVCWGIARTLGTVGRKSGTRFCPSRCRSRKKTFPQDGRPRQWTSSTRPSRGSLRTVWATMVQRKWWITHGSVMWTGNEWGDVRSHLPTTQCTDLRNTKTSCWEGKMQWCRRKRWSFCGRRPFKVGMQINIDVFK